MCQFSVCQIVEFWLSVDTAEHYSYQLFWSVKENDIITLQKNYKYFHWFWFWMKTNRTISSNARMFKGYFGSVKMSNFFNL